MTDRISEEVDGDGEVLGRILGVEIDICGDIRILLATPIASARTDWVEAASSSLELFSQDYMP